ncbi:hypothetical protein ACWDAO_10425 [Streptomyces sp. NPDC001212]
MPRTLPAPSATPVHTEYLARRTSLRLSATLLLVGQLLYIVVTQFHTDGDANNHPAVFTEYAGSGSWTAVHLGQFAGMAVLLAGLVALFFALDVQAGTARWAGRFGAASAVATLGLYGVLQAVDGVALKQAVNAWASAPYTEKPARFAGAEAIRWLEWGVRSYQNFALGLALLLFAAAVMRTAWVPRPIGRHRRHDVRLVREPGGEGASPCRRGRPARPDVRPRTRRARGVPHRRDLPAVGTVRLAHGDVITVPFTVRAG